MCAEKIKIAFDSGTCARNQFEVFDAGIANLHANTIFAVLNDRVVQIQLVFGWGDDVVRSKAGEVKLADEPKIPIVIRLINQRRLGENSLQAQLIIDKPDNAAARRNGRILVDS